MTTDKWLRKNSLSNNERRLVRLLAAKPLRVALPFTISAAIATAQDATSIKRANLKCTDLELMEKNDPVSQLDILDLLPGSPPNIVFLFANGQCTYAVGCYGDKDAQTPNMDQLARDGMVFDCQTPR